MYLAVVRAREGLGILDKGGGREGRREGKGGREECCEIALCEGRR